MEDSLNNVDLMLNEDPNKKRENFVYYADKKTFLRNPNDFIFLGQELHKYREIRELGSFYSYTNKSVKIIFIDKTIVMMNADQQYVKVINKNGEKLILYVPEITSNDQYYFYVKHLFDYYDLCFNPQAISDNKWRQMNLEKEIENRINKIDLCNHLLFNKGNEDDYSNQYYMYNIPTVLDIQNLLKKNQKALDGIKEMKQNNINNNI